MVINKRKINFIVNFFCIIYASIGMPYSVADSSIVTNNFNLKFLFFIFLFPFCSVTFFFHDDQSNEAGLFFF